MNRKPIGLETPHRKTQGAKPLSLETVKEINARLEAMARECERMPFGDTAQSFAAWIRGHKL
jgi:uncharacterized small protein (DUF1192 family)